MDPSRILGELQWCLELRVRQWKGRGMGRFRCILEEEHMGLAEDWMWAMGIGEETSDLKVSGSCHFTSPHGS